MWHRDEGCRQLVLGTTFCMFEDVEWGIYGIFTPRNSGTCSYACSKELHSPPCQSPLISSAFSPLQLTRKTSLAQAESKPLVARYEQALRLLQIFSTTQLQTNHLGAPAAPNVSGNQLLQHSAMPRKIQPGLRNCSMGCSCLQKDRSTS